MLTLYEKKYNSPLLMGTAGYPSPEVLKKAIKEAQVDIVTVSLRREAAKNTKNNKFWELLKKLEVKVLPNTAGCRSAKEAITLARMSREIFGTNWVKLEVIHNDDNLHPDLYGLTEATQILCEENFEVFPYTTEDLSIAERLVNLGCKVLMPWASPIGSGQGLINEKSLITFRSYFPDITLIIDAGLGTPSHAVRAMEIGFDGILVNTAISKANNPVTMAKAFSEALQIGKLAKNSGPIQPREMAIPSTPVAGTPFFKI